MASRVAGAVLALTAAALLAVSVIAAAWWNGHPHYNGAEIKAKEISVGPLGATGCNTGGDGACMSVPVDPTFETIGFALAGVTGLLAITALALAALTASVHARRKSFAIFVIVGSMIAALLALVLVVVGPKIRTEAPLPFSTGLFVFFGGVACALGSSVFAMRTPSIQPRGMQLAPPRQSRQSMQMAQVPISPHGGLDVHALLTQDQLRPSSLGPEPRLARGSPVQSPGGALPGPSGPLGAIGGPQQPLFSSAPQLRPLYDVAPGQGGTGGFVPQPAQNFPMRPPTPIPRDQISAHAGIPTPASIDVQKPVTVAGFPPPPQDLDATDRDLLRAAGLRPKTLPPPNRSKSASIPPQMSPLVQPRPLPTLANVSVPPPPNVTLATPDPDEPFDSMQTYQRDEPPPPPLPSLAPAWPPVEAPTVPSKSPPPPAKSAQSKAAAIAARVAAMPRTPTGSKPVVPMPARIPPRATPRPPTQLTEDSTDVSTRAVEDDAPGTETFETATNESTSFAAKPQPPKSKSSTMETQPAPSDDGDDEMMTVGREKVARTDVELPTVRPPKPCGP